MEQAQIGHEQKMSAVINTIELNMSFGVVFYTNPVRLHSSFMVIHTTNRVRYEIYKITSIAYEGSF